MPRRRRFDSSNSNGFTRDRHAHNPIDLGAETDRVRTTHVVRHRPARPLHDALGDTHLMSTAAVAGELQGELARCRRTHDGADTPRVAAASDDDRARGCIGQLPVMDRDRTRGRRLVSRSDCKSRQELEGALVELDNLRPSRRRRALPARAGLGESRSYDRREIRSLVRSFCFLSLEISALSFGDRARRLSSCCSSSSRRRCSAVSSASSVSFETPKGRVVLKRPPTKRPSSSTIPPDRECGNASLHDLVQGHVINRDLHSGQDQRRGGGQLLGNVGARVGLRQDGAGARQSARVRHDVVGT